MNGWLLIGLLGLIMVAIGLSWRHWAMASIALLRRRAGLQRHSIGVDGFELVYRTAGPREAPVMLLLHGFGGDGDNWVFLVPRLKQQFRIVVPDLPGFGDTGFLAGQSYSLDAQVARLKDFVDMLHLEHVHLVGNSMGGYIAAAFAAAYPDMVASLGLFNAAGVDMPKRSPFYAAALEGENLLLVRQPADFDRILKLVYHRKPYLPGFLRDYLVARNMAQAEGQSQIFHEIFGHRIWLDDRLGRISAPTLILWGDDDRVLDISSIQLFKAGIPHAQTAVLHSCGHVPMLEKPAVTARFYLDFLANVGMPATAASSSPLRLDPRAEIR